MAKEIAVVQAPVEKLEIVLDKTHPLYDERVNMILDPKLVENVKLFGILEPILVTSGDDGKALVVAGRQRLRAAIKAGLKTVPVIFKDEKVDGVMYTENAARRDDDPLTKMQNICRYMQAHKEEKDVMQSAAVIFCCSAQSISNALRVTSCDPKVIKAVERGEISTTVALQVYKLPAEKQVETVEKVVAEAKAAGKRPTVKAANAKAGGRIGKGKGKGERAHPGQLRRKDEIIKELVSCIKEWNEMDAAQQERDTNGIHARIDILGWCIHDEAEDDEEKNAAAKAKDSKKKYFLIPESCQ
jgi:ParB family chromosome partitioning protein